MKYNKLTAFLLTFATLISVFACNTMANSNFEFGSNKVNLQPSDWAENWQIYKGNSANGETFTADTHTNEENEVDQISFEVPDNSYDGVYVNLFVPAISLNTNAYLAFDYDNAVDTNTSKFYTGTAHISQFGEYDINATVEVKDGKIKGITVTGDNFKGTYATINQNILQTAFNGLKDAFTGKDATNAEEVHNIDAVTGATYSSNGIIDAVMKLLICLQNSLKPAFIV